MDNCKQVTVILGSEACDLDSAVSSYVYSKFVERSKTSDELIKPVLNIPSSDFHLKTGVKYLFDKLFIRKEEFFFRDQINLASLAQSHVLKIILVDQNVLRGNDTLLEEYVKEVIDHHVLERNPDPSCELTVEMVGSCATLIAEKIFRTAPEFLGGSLATLLYGAILVDTANLSDTAKRATKKDIEIAEQLATLLPDVNREELFNELQKAKEDVSSLSSLDILRKDMKLIGPAGMKLAFSSFPLFVKEYLERADSATILYGFAAEKSLKCHILMGSRICPESGKIVRDLGVCSTDDNFAENVIKCLKEAKDPSLGLIPVSFSVKSTSIPLVIHLFSQENALASRKAILPIVKHFLDAETETARESARSLNESNGQGDISSNQPLTPPTFDDRLTREDSPFVFTPPSIPTPNGVHTHLVMNMMQFLSVGDSHQGSSSHSHDSSSYNSCPYTPQNSCAEEPTPSHVNLPSFNSRDMLEKIESKRTKLRGCDIEETTTYPFTPKNSFVDSSFDDVYSRLSQVSTIDSDVIVRKLSEKGKRNPMPDVIEDE